MRDLVFKIEAEDEGCGLEFFDADLSGFPLKFQENAEKGPSLDEKARYHLREMAKRSWIDLVETDGFSIVKLQPLGHEAADFFRANVWWKRFGRFLSHWLDRIFHSVVVPIVVTVLTVFVMSYFGLGSK